MAVTTADVRKLAGIRVMSDPDLASHLKVARRDVRLDLERMGLSVSAAEMDSLVVSKAAFYASRVERTSESDSTGAASSNYVPLNWEHEYCKVLSRIMTAHPVRGGPF